MMATPAYNHFLFTLPRAGRLTPPPLSSLSAMPSEPPTLETVLHVSDDSVPVGSGDGNTVLPVRRGHTDLWWNEVRGSLCVLGRERRNVLGATVHSRSGFDRVGILRIVRHRHVGPVVRLRNQTETGNAVLGALADPVRHVQPVVARTHLFEGVVGERLFLLAPTRRVLTLPRCDRRLTVGQIAHVVDGVTRVDVPVRTGRRVATGTLTGRILYRPTGSRIDRQSVFVGGLGRHAGKRV